MICSTMSDCNLMLRLMPPIRVFSAIITFYLRSDKLVQGVNSCAEMRLSQSGSVSWQVYGDLYARVKRYYNVLDLHCEEQSTSITYAQNPKSESERRNEERTSWIEG